MKINRLLIGLGLALLILPQLAISADVSVVTNGHPPFCELSNAITSFTTGAFSKIMALTMLLMGGAMGVTKGSPIPAITGVAGACFINFGPQILDDAMGTPECKAPIIKENKTKAVNPELIATKPSIEIKAEKKEDTTVEPNKVPEKQVVQGTENWTY